MVNKRLVEYLPEITQIRDYLHKECGAPFMETNVLETLLLATHRFTVVEQSKILIRKKMRFTNFVLDNYGDKLPPIRKALIFHIGSSMIHYARVKEEEQC